MAVSRRNFLKASALSARYVYVYAARSRCEANELKVGLIGCGGRGRGAANNTLNADDNCKIYALADAFMPNAQGAAEGLQAAFEDRVDVEGRVFAGIDAYKRLSTAAASFFVRTAWFPLPLPGYAVEQGACFLRKTDGD